MWLVKNHHPAIISREAFDLVQTIIEYKKNDRFLRPDSSNPLSAKLYCGICGKKLVYQSRSDGKQMYSCNVNRRNIEKEKCSLPPIQEEEINAICIKAMKSYYFDSSLTANLLDCLTSIGQASHKQEELNTVKEEITTTQNRLTAIIEEKMETDSEEDDERLSNDYKEAKKHLNDLKAKLDTLSGETYQSFIFEARSKEIASLITNMDNDECYLKLIDEVIVNEDNSITIIDNAGHHVTKENISKNIKKINGLEEVIHGYYTSPITTKVYKYKIVRLEDYPWLKK